MKVIVFGGTTEGREAIPALLREGCEVTLSVATETGLEALLGGLKSKAEGYTRGVVYKGEKEAGDTYDAGGVKVLVGRKEEEELKQLLSEYEACIDATHPYAELITKNLKRACEVMGTRYFRLLRRDINGKTLNIPKASVVSAGRDQADGIENTGNRADTPADETEATGNLADTAMVVYVKSVREAAELLKKTGEKKEDKDEAYGAGNILLTTGSKELSAFSEIERERLYVRVLPTGESIAACEKNGIPHRNIIALWGPFLKELNLALLRQFHISYLVTKESGREGGFDEKLAAAKEAGCLLIVIERPKEEGMSLAEILEFLKSEKS